MRRSRRPPLYRLPTATRAARRDAARDALILVVLDLLAALLFAGQETARSLGFHRALGPAWFALPADDRPAALALAVLVAGFGLAGLCFARTRIVALHLLPLAAFPALLGRGPLYPPLAVLVWQARLGKSAALAPILERGLTLLVAGAVGLILVTVTAYALRSSQLRETGDTHGSAHFATPAEIRATGLLEPGPGVVVGAIEERGLLGSRLRTLRDATARHVLVYAPSGAGKTTSIVVPTLLEWPGSVLATDIKGELWERTAAARDRLGLPGHRSLRFDPSCAAPSPDTSAARYNPLLAIPDGPGDVRAAQALAEILANPDGVDRPPDFWEQSARAFLTGLLLHVRFAERNPTLGTCAHLLADPAREVNSLLLAMLHAEHDPDGHRGFRDTALRARTGTHPVVAAAARSILDLADRTSSGVLATARSFLEIFRDPLVQANTAASDFTAEDLRHPDRATSLYLVIAPSDLARLRGLVRIVLHQLVHGLTERMDDAPSDAGTRPRLLLALEEFPAWGKLDFLGRAIAYLRGYGIRALISIQSLHQLHEVYGEHESITANCATQIAFAPNDLATAKRLSEMTGVQTVHFDRRSHQGGEGLFAGSRISSNPVELGRPLLTPDEVRRLPPEECLIYVAGHPVVRGRRVEESRTHP